MDITPHPYHQANADEWHLCELAYHGGEEFINQVLTQHQLEYDDDFQRRRKRAFYLNFVKRIVNAMTDLIFDRGIRRPSTTDKFSVLAPFYRRASYFGEPFDGFMRRASRLASVYGWVIIPVEFLATKSPSLADVEQGIIYPRVRLFTPLEFIDWDREGDKFLYATVQRETFIREGSETITITETIIYTDKDVSIYKGDELYATYTHNLGFAPLVLLNDSTVDQHGFSEPLIKDIERIAGAIVNWASVLDEIFERQALSQLVCPDEGSIYEEAATLAEQLSDGLTNIGDIDDYTKRVLKKVGTSKIFTYPANAGHPPQYISPPTSDMRSAWEILISLAQLMFFLVGLGGVREDLYTASAKAREQSLSIMRSYLKTKAINLKNAEEEIIKLYFDYMPENTKPKSISVIYPDEIDVASFFDTYRIMVETVFAHPISEEFAKETARKLIAECPYLTDEEKKTIIEKL